MTAHVREMAYLGEVPWHGMGNPLEAGASMEEWLEASGLDYKIKRSRVRFGDGVNQHIWEDKHVLFRNDDKHPLGLVSSRYRIVQPNECLEFFRDLCAENRFALETAGCLFDGARYWALAKTERSVELPGHDLVNQYLLLASSCDGSLATTGMETSVRVVCNNTLGAALDNGAKSAVKVKHSTTFDATRMLINLELLDANWQKFSDNAHQLASCKLTRKEAASLLISALGEPKKAADEQPRAVANIFNMYENVARGRELASASSTAWGLVNAATEYYDHVAGRSQQTRLASAWFGDYASKKEAVYNTALSFARDEGDVVVKDDISLNELINKLNY